MKAIKGHGEVKQNGVGNTWWEKSIVFVNRVREKTSKVVKGTWQKLIDAQRAKVKSRGPELDR